MFKGTFVCDTTLNEMSKDIFATSDSKSRCGAFLVKLNAFCWQNRYRRVQCSWPGCEETMLTTERAEHWRTHVQARGVHVFTEPGDGHVFEVPRKARELKVQLWGGGGASGHLRGMAAGAGGGGTFLEAIIPVHPGETLYITVGSGGQVGF